MEKSINTDEEEGLNVDRHTRIALLRLIVYSRSLHNDSRRCKRSRVNRRKFKRHREDELSLLCTVTAGKLARIIAQKRKKKKKKDYIEETNRKQSRSQILLHRRHVRSQFKCFQAHRPIHDDRIIILCEFRPGP